MQFSKRNNLENSKMKNMKVTLEEEGESLQRNFPKLAYHSNGYQMRNAFVFTPKFLG